MKPDIVFSLALGIALTLPARADLLKGFGQDSEVVRRETEFDCLPSPPPPPPPAQHSGAEGLPPLPLPVVPLRRTEKKNPPRPPVLISRIVPADQRHWGDSFGNTDNLLRWMAEHMNLHFSSINMPENEIPDQLADIPILYRTGLDQFSFDPAQRARLKNYLEQGGTMILEARCGRWDFFAAALNELQNMFPERPPYRLNFDHPLYRAFFDMRPEHIQYRGHARQAGAQNGMPGAIGIDIGCRTAVFLFRWDVSSGWDGLDEQRAPHCLGYTVETSRILGANLMAYVTAERSAATPLSRALQFVDTDQQDGDRFVIAQVRYQGLWKTHQAGLSMLLDAFHRKTQTAVSFEPHEVDLESDRIFSYPLLYITGHHDFELPRQARDNLRNHLMRGGVLFAESCCGRAGFDRGIRRLLGQVFEEVTLTRLPASHPIFMLPNRVEKATPRPALARRLRTDQSIDPVLYGLHVNGRLAVIYSPHGLSTGWELADSPYCAGLTAEDSIKLGVNILTHSLLQ